MVNITRSCMGNKTMHAVQKNDSKMESVTNLKSENFSSVGCITLVYLYLSQAPFMPP